MIKLGIKYLESSFIKLNADCSESILSLSAQADLLDNIQLC